MSDDFLYVAAVILLPVIPALIIFKLIPGGSTADAEGPFQGLKIKLGGAFAGYFIVVLVAWAQVRLMLEPSRVRIWQVTGNVSFGEAGAGPVTAAIVQVEPPNSGVKADGRIGFALAIPRKHSGEELRYLYVSYPGYAPVSLELDPDGKHLAAFPSDAQKAVRVDDKNSVIDVGTIILKKATRPGQ